jgi:hypothetical protein
LNYVSLLKYPQVLDRAVMAGRFTACRWYSTFGKPGRGVAAWLDSTHFAVIQVSGREAYNWRPWLVTYSFGSYYFDHDEWRRDSWIGRDRSRHAMAACAEGNDAACNSLLLSNLGVPTEGGNELHTPAWIGEGRLYNVQANRDGAALLDRLVAEMGPIQFAAFWKSDEPIPQAFHSIRGGSLAEWIRTQARVVVPSERARVLPPIAAIIPLIIIAIAFILLGTRAVARRSGFA